MSEQKSRISSIIDNVSKGFCLGILLYPLDRFHTIKQVQKSFSNSAIQHQKNIVTMSTHYGIRGLFRGLSPYILKGTSLLFLSNTFAVQQSNNKTILNVAIIAAAYLIFYPLEIARMRMCTDVQRTRFYRNLRDCFSKIKKNEGISALYRGAALGTSLFLMQVYLIKMLFSQAMSLKQSSKQLNNIPGNGIVQFIGCLMVKQILMYPLDTIKKNYQLNGALGHTTLNSSIRQTMKSISKSYFSGFTIRVGSLSIYSALYLYSCGKTTKTN